MVPFYVLIGAFAILRLVGAPGVAWLDNWVMPLRIALALMFFLTASAHWGKRRPDLVRMVPPVFTKPETLVTVTGILEILGAIGLLIPSTARLAATCLALLLLALFPANVHAARAGVGIGGKGPTPLPLRTLLQVVFIGALIFAGWSAE